MADFCEQCSKKLNFPENDMRGIAEPNYVAGVLCEECGPTWVDPDGRCVVPEHGDHSEEALERYFKQHGGARRLGWLVFRFSPGIVSNGTAIAFMREVFGHAEGRRANG